MPVITLQIPQNLPLAATTSIADDDLMMVDDELSKIEANNTKSYDSVEMVFDDREEEKKEVSPSLRVMDQGAKTDSDEVCSIVEDESTPATSEAATP